MAAKRDATSAATRAKVLKAARECFSERGFDAVTTRDLAMRAGTSTGAIFAHFPGKESLFEAAMDRKNPAVRVRDLLKRLDTVEARDLLADLYGKPTS